MSASRSIALAAAVAAALLGSSVAALAQMPPCANEFIPLRDAVAKQADQVKASIDRKAPREEICSQIKSFASTEAKFVKYMEDNQAWCGIPPDAIGQLKTNHGHTLGLRQKACAGGPVGGGARAVPAGPGLSDALGTSRAPTPNNTMRGRGTFDTLTGTPFKPQ
jgi:hypothetical protein